MTSRLSLGTALAVGAMLVCGGNALAQPDFQMTWDASGDGIGPNQYNWNQYGNFPAFGTYQFDDLPGQQFTGWQYAGELAGPLDEWSLQWNCVFNNDTDGVATSTGSFVTANIVVTNNDQVNFQNFSLLMSLPVNRVLMTPLSRGSVVGTVTDLTIDDATVAAPSGGAIYTPLIDGTAEAIGVLMADPFSQNAGGPLNSNTVGPQDFGIPAPVVASQDADSTIAIRLDFDLSPGDSASFTAIFEILPLPGPGGLPVLAAIGLLAGRRRRR